MAAITETDINPPENLVLSMPWPKFNQISVDNYPSQFPTVGHTLQTNDFNFAVKDGGSTTRKSGNDISAVFPGWEPGKEVVLVLCPHDDDGPIGAGNILLRLSLECRAGNAKVFFVHATDGSQGYCSEEERGKIISIRQQESLKCLESLGYPPETLLNLGFPDDSLSQFMGRRPGMPWDPYYLDGHTGLENALTHVIRLTQPTRILLPTGTDLHTDHKNLQTAGEISRFHAGGAIWPALGTPLLTNPQVMTFPVYCKGEEPTVAVIASPAAQHILAGAIGSYASQIQVESLMERVRQNPLQILCNVDPPLYDPSRDNGVFNGISFERNA